jgi:2-oxoisovalerate dehydrogenase E2 component (dihydrolipoyl transacylase)
LGGVDLSRFIFKLPDVGEGTAEAEIVRWHVSPGDVVAEDQVVVDVMTDKATVEITSPVAGQVLECRGVVGAKAAVGGELVVFETDATGPPPSAPETASDLSAPPAPLTAAERAAAQKPAGGKALAAPAVRAYARDKGVDVAAVHGTGPEGRVLRSDVDAFHGRDRPCEGVEEIKVIGLRRRIAERMQEAVRRIPHASYVEEVDVTELEALREQLNAERRAEQPKLTPLAFFARALVGALTQSPQLNAHYDDEAGVLLRHAAVHLGLATQTEAGLVVPVVRDAGTRGIWDMAAEIARVSAAARDGSARREELGGSTITLSSLGPLGGLASTPIVNWPEVAIIAPNRIIERPAVHAGVLTVRKMMNVSMSFDHRVIDGYDAALFMQHVKVRLEEPARLVD